MADLRYGGPFFAMAALRYGGPLPKLRENCLSTTFTQWVPKATEFDEITQNKGHHAVQGHSLSRILVPTESSYATSSQWLPSILHRFQVYSQLLVKFSLAMGGGLLHFKALAGGDSLQISG